MQASPYKTFAITVLAALASALAVSLLFVVLVFAFTSLAQAQDDYLPQIRLSDVQQGSLLFRMANSTGYLQAPLLHSDVDIDVTAMVARVSLKQHFENTTKDWMEGVYVFPLPENAAVDHLRMQIGERVIDGQIKVKEEAKKIYEQAKQEGKKAALLEQERPNLFTTSVANIGPGETITVDIEYQQAVRYDQGQFSLRFPMTMTPRYIPGAPRLIQEEIAVQQGNGWAMDTDQVSDASRITPPVHIGEQKINPVSLRMVVDAGFPLDKIESPYHAIDTNYLDKQRIAITLAEGRVPADRDFELRWRPQAGAAPKAAFFTESMGDEIYSLIMILPPNAASSSMLPKDVIYIIDTSGSMSGASIDQAKQALALALDRLRPSDRFNVIQFNSITEQLFTATQLADEGAIRRAKSYVRSLQANGGTEMLPALTAALNASSHEGYLRQVIFLTDGSVGNEDQLFSLINNKLGSARLFTVGIGSAPNSHFMTKAAQFGRGTFTYIGNVNEVAEKMKSLFDKIESPVMAGLKVEWPQGEVEMWPQRLPDLYLGEPLIISARSKTMTGHLQLSGVRDQEHWEAKLPLQGGRDGKGIGVLWARAKIDHLMDSRHEGAKEEEVKASVVNVALKHHLVSAYTSLVAVDVTPSRPMETALKQGMTPHNLPHGSQQFMQLPQLAKTATPADLNFLTGLILLLAASLLWLILDQRLMLKNAKFGGRQKIERDCGSGF